MVYMYSSVRLEVFLYFVSPVEGGMTAFFWLCKANPRCHVTVCTSAESRPGAKVNQLTVRCFSLSKGFSKEMPRRALCRSFFPFWCLSGTQKHSASPQWCFAKLHRHLRGNGRKTNFDWGFILPHLFTAWPPCSTLASSRPVPSSG